MTGYERVTYSRGDEILDHAVRHLNRVVERLEELRARSDLEERVTLLLDSVELEQRNLVGSLERLPDDMPDGALESFYSQYRVDLPGKIDGPDEEPLTTLGLVKWLEAQNDYLQRTFRELADNAEQELVERDADLPRVFAGIADQIESHNRALSMEYQRTEEM